MLTHYPLKKKMMVPVAQLCDGCDGVESGILCQGVGDNFHGFGEGLEAVGIGSNQGVGVVHKLKGQLGFWR